MLIPKEEIIIMTIIDNTIYDETLQFLLEFAPTLKKLFSSDVSISISDKEKVIISLGSQELGIADMSDIPLKPTDPMPDVMKNNRTLVMDIPKEAYGIAVKTVMVPVTNRSRKVVGCIGISASRNNQVNLIEIAEKFAASSEEIGAASEQLASSATILSDTMNEVAVAQENLSNQVENTTKILDMINNVAKNTRILGFNAGIEAARSGEHGKGFSVVAKEITKLADQSAESVNEIRQLLESMKEKVTLVTKNVSETINLSENQATAIVDISTSIQQLTEVAETIDELAKKI